MKLIFKVFTVIFLLFFAFTSFASITKQNTIPVLVLSGTHHEMGINYGRQLTTQLHEVLAILKDFYINERRITLEELNTQADLFYQRYPHTYQLFLEGVAKGADLPLEDVKILNAMETLSEAQNVTDAHCSFIYLPPNKTTAGAGLIGRNYDYSQPFDQLANYLTVTVLLEDNAVPTAFISMAGQVYCPTCINANGLFLELNNGMPSGGYYIERERQSLLINMLLTLQHSTTLDQAKKQLNAYQGDYSLILNSADATHANSFEYSTTMGMKHLSPETGQPFASTNFFLHPDWGDSIPEPRDALTWDGVTRRNNLLNLANTTEKFDLTSFKTMMNTNIEDGGAVVDRTIYQLIFDESTLDLYIKINNQSDEWQYVPLGELFKQKA